MSLWLGLVTGEQKIWPMNKVNLKDKKSHSNKSWNFSRGGIFEEVKPSSLSSRVQDFQWIISTINLNLKRISIKYCWRIIVFPFVGRITENTMMSQLSFQTDAIRSLSDWPKSPPPRFDWLRAPSSKHLIENLSQVFLVALVLVTSQVYFTKKYF